MLEITVTAKQGLAEPNGAATRFGPDGGTIGRADTNRLVLDDPDRTVSRVHAQVVCKGGLYAIIDRGSNPLQLNGQALGTGCEAPLNLGDRLTIGGFELMVSQLDTGGDEATSALPANAVPVPAADDPFADLLEGLAPPASPPPKAPTASSIDEGPFPDPLGMKSSAPPDPFADLLGGGPNHGASTAEEPRPDDFSDLIAPTRGAKAESIDALFGLGAPSSGHDPLAMTPLADPLLQPNTASSQDPLAAFSQAAPLQPPVRSDHLPVGQFGFVPPQAVAPPALNASPHELRPLPTGTDTGTPLPPSFRHRPESSAASPAPLDSGLRRNDEREESAKQPLARPSSPDHELLAAFLRGLGPLQQPPAQLTPGLMERVGEMLRTATEGTLQLLLTRQEFKKEVRAQATMIAAQANNPLKFSPTVEVALSHLLGPGVRGFMPAQAAMQDAYQDLRAHEFGVMVGTRAALAHVIERFEPTELEKNIAARSKLDAIFSANRKAKLWDQFVSLYDSIAREAEDDFHNLFGKAFLKAYEEQMERLKTHETNGRT